MQVSQKLLELYFDMKYLISRDKLGPFEVLCNVTYLIKTICYSVKFLDYVCDLVDFVSDAIVGVVRKSMNHKYN